AMVERCPRELGRVTVVKTKPEDDEKPEEVFSVGLGSAAASVVAVTRQHVAVVERDSSTLVVFDSGGREVGRYPVRVGEPGFRANVQVEATTVADRVYWHTGADTVALDPATLAPVWTLPDTLGPGTTFGGKLL